MYLTVAAGELNIGGESLNFTRNGTNKKKVVHGIHDANSSITVDRAVNFVSNKAENREGISWETKGTWIIGWKWPHKLYNKQGQSLWWCFICG